MITRYLLFAASASTSIGFGFALLTIEQINEVLRFFAYPTLFGGFGLFIYYGARVAQVANPLAWIRQRANAIALLCSLIGTIFLFTREPPRYKIVFDEPAIINTSLNLHHDRDPVIKEHSHMGVDSPSAIDKRPFFFAFLVSLLHDLLGYDVANGHIANFLITFSFLIAIYTLLTLIKDRYAGYIGIGAFCALPLIAQNASGLGFEILNILMIAITMISAILYWRNPQNHNLSLLVFSTILLAHTRYESSIYALATGMIIVAKWVQLRKVSLPPAVLLAPLFFIPLAWQNRIVQSQSAKFMQLDSNDLLDAFSLSHIPTNLKKALVYFSGTDQELAGSLILGPLGLISFVAILAYLFLNPVKRILEANLFPLLAITSVTIFLFFLLMAYYWGSFTDPVATRLSLPLWLLAMLSLSVLLSSLGRRYRPLPPIILTLAFVHALPIMAAHPYSNVSLPINRYNWIESVIGDKLNSRTLVISDLVRMYQNRRIPGFGFQRINHVPGKIHLHQHLKTYDSIYVIQYGQYTDVGEETTKVINDGFKLGPMYELDIVAEASHYPYNFTRISRITGVDLSVMESESKKPIEDRPYLNRTPVDSSFINKSFYKDWMKSLP